MSPHCPKELHLPFLSGVASVWNDHSLLNITTNVIGLTEYGDGMVFPALFGDYMLWVDPPGPEEDMPLNFSIPKEPEQTGLDTYDGAPDSW
jgi:hypothetical protein